MSCKFYILRFVYVFNHIEATSHLSCSLSRRPFIFFFFFNDRAPTEIYPLPLPDALPISERRAGRPAQTHCGGQRADDQRVQYSRRRSHRNSRPNTPLCCQKPAAHGSGGGGSRGVARSEEHTSELHSPDHLVCRLLLQKKK